MITVPMTSPQRLLLPVQTAAAEKTHRGGAGSHDGRRPVVIRGQSGHTVPGSTARTVAVRVTLVCGGSPKLASLKMQ
ncbi:hypothetical protein GCM10017566_24100 [Amycolatopsis bartoniae]|uniref:Uncharacterized protein n=1 Tax=Amycolatopsis bartoniae TaxID=941986 RepID=A0A8H9IVW8_9PSEU|nr:hypothetical protein GCM10017566_24100 [Amycolatopsis bartoniae]